MRRSPLLELPADLVDLQRACNVASAKRWRDFTEHRARITALASGAAPDHRSGRLAVLGAGNANDLDVRALLRRFGEVHLFDLDGAALGRARARHEAPRLVVHDPIDLSGALAALPRFRERLPTDEEIARLPRTSVETVLEAIHDRFDVVLSSCLLTQILHGIQAALGREHPSLTAISCAQVVAHARLIARLARPGATGLLVTDVTSSQIVRAKELWDEVPPADFLTQLELARLCASGTGPQFLERVLMEDPVVGPLIEAPTFVSPWRWRWSPRRSYLVHALAFKARRLPGRVGIPRYGVPQDRPRSSSERSG
jgi:hypothetical protein